MNEEVTSDQKQATHDDEGPMTGCDPIDKSLIDTFDYAIGLRSGGVIRYTSASVSNDGIWLNIDGAGVQVFGGIQAMRTDSVVVDPSIRLNPPYCPDRGISVRISDIMWAVDAPCGS